MLIRMIRNIILIITVGCYKEVTLTMGLSKPTKEELGHETTAIQTTNEMISRTSRIRIRPDLLRRGSEGQERIRTGHENKRPRLIQGDN